MGYFLQDPYYAKLSALNGIDPLFLFVVVSTTFPHYVRLGTLSDQARTRNMQRVDDLLQTYSECARRNYWPAYRIRPDLSRVGVEEFNLYIKEN